ncbi:hypothetical protein CAI21_12480 [Alkalilimnicola ehrlichii]|uniref:DsbA family oxidoreductase n=1 Tax=Alkalilimnicola ehrlichii TaxID=351052 RepID=UPI000E2F41FC|nr:DsbA family protein [Alkalilimnicola ehrlichii]RFA28383.1 hypothetical protein CAI21_12480 [Alkalilimnicola ehrlichii]
MTANMDAIAVPVSLFLDYSCPFCYIASERLLRLRERHRLRIDWRFIETRPHIPTSERADDDFGIKSAARTTISDELQRLMEEDGMSFSPPAFSPNTRRALLLAQACLEQLPNRFSDLHSALFRAYLVEGRDIGEPSELEALASELALSSLLPEAWQDARYVNGLLRHVQAAQKVDLRAVPTLVVAGRPFAGAVSMGVLEQALEEHADTLTEKV